MDFDLLDGRERGFRMRLGGGGRRRGVRGGRERLGGGLKVGRDPVGRGRDSAGLVMRRRGRRDGAVKRQRPRERLCAFLRIQKGPQLAQAPQDKGERDRHDPQESAVAPAMTLDQPRSTSTIP